MLMVVRDPILGRPVEIQTWIVAIGVSAASLIAGSLVCTFGAASPIWRALASSSLF
jgi:hypothetical protein